MKRSDYHKPVAQHGGGSSPAADPDPLAYDAGPEPHNPSLDEPWEGNAADALVRLYESGDARSALQSPFSDEFRTRLSRLEPRLPPAADVDEATLAGTETRLAAITGEIQQALEALRADPSLQSLRLRFDRFEKQFASALANVATRTDVEGLKLIEAHVSELFERADAAKEQLSRLLVVEAQLAGLKANLSDERISRLASALVPSQQELGRIATAAAEAAVQRIAGQSGTGSNGGHTHDLLTNFIEERRRSEHLAGEALETMQQAMQHILDRLDSIEMTQASLLDDRGPSEGDHDLERHDEPFVASRRLTAIAPGAQEMADRSPQAAQAYQPAEELTLAKLGPAAPLGQQAHAGETEAASAPKRKIASPFRSCKAAQRASATAFPGSSVLLVAGLSAFMLAGYWLVSGIGLRAPLESHIQSAETGTGPAGKSGVVALKPSANEAMGNAADASNGTQPQNGQLDGTDTRAALDRPGSTVQAPLGMVIDQPAASLSPEEIMRLRQRQRMANLSTRLGQQQAVETGSAVLGERETNAKGASAQGAEDTIGTILEMPPITIGPQSLRIAAAKGDPSAQFDVAARFAEGKGVKQDFAQAAIWYQRAATQGLAAAQYRLAALYERGLGVTADTARARVWYKRAAEQGNVKAMHNMAVLSVGKDGTSSDYEAAVKWFTDAAEYGVTDSQYNLAVLLESGLGAPKDLTAAYRWYTLAARGGDQEAVRRMDRLKGRMSPGVIKTVETEIAAWRPRASDALVNDAHAAGEAWKSRASSKTD